MKECPVCHDHLKEVSRYGVLMDVCPRCRGVWLDRGELEKVVSLAREFEADYEDVHKRRHEEDYEKPPHRYEDHRYEGHHYHSKDYHHKKKKKHGIFEIFGDLFD
ncbi:MAG: zf-TFIIB domain-containing protein [Bacillota bacterium]